MLPTKLFLDNGLVRRIRRLLAADLYFALTDSRAFCILHLPGETEAGNAGEHPARDSRSGLRQNVTGRMIINIILPTPNFPERYS